MIPRIVMAEALDDLAADDPDAIRSRIDLQRVHRSMGTRAILLRGLTSMATGHHKAIPLRLLEIGAGDGSLMLSVAQALTPRWPAVELTLLDRQALVDRSTIAHYAQVGWTVVEEVCDVFEWVAGSVDLLPGGCPTAHWDLIVANLFLHHFEDQPLASLLTAIANQSSLFFACEPRRDWLDLAGSHMIGAIGVNHVTREDSVLSVHAGFNGHELTALWPKQAGAWHVQEYSAGLFSHCFRAERLELN
ncbi:hypothetical protein GALL_443710 [mine drainage metagenome]|uniref:Methyltransferase domain-containing protein n=1 Tax=mine drainage metagenome TaxID=410659 RepID=A0A1J5Q2A4_9ZZZZ